MTLYSETALPEAAKRLSLWRRFILRYLLRVSCREIKVTRINAVDLYGTIVKKGTS
jgi:hypothetical protein